MNLKEYQTSIKPEANNKNGSEASLKTQNGNRGPANGKRRKKRNKKKNAGTKPDRATSNGKVSAAAEPSIDNVDAVDGKLILDQSHDSSSNAIPAAQNDPSIGRPPPINLSKSIPLPQTHDRAPLSPRKKTLMRHKNSDYDIQRESLIIDAKGNLRNHNSFADTDVSPIGPLNISEKVPLFDFMSAKVVLHQELVGSNPKQSGTLLGHGRFEVFQLHKGDVTYFSCGSSFVYPLLPKLKVLRTSFNQFILPLANPERYWRISINTEDGRVIKNLEKTLEQKVQYRSFYLNEANKSDDLQYTDNGNHHSPLPYPTSTTPPYTAQHFLPIANELPESPPSAPISPQQINSFNHINEHPVSAFPETKWSPIRQQSSQSITSAIASFDLKDGKDHPFRNPYQVEQPKPRRHLDPTKFTSPLKIDLRLRYPDNGISNDRKSGSSMDSLLDEFEENISTTRSITFSVAKHDSHVPSRAPSRQSITSALSKQKYTFPRFDDHEAPPAPSSEYIKMPSRRSSRSELYTSESNWMEPNAPVDTGRLSRSRSSYSVASGHYPRNVKAADLNNTYHNIYRSITQRNLSQYSGSISQSVKERTLNLKLGSERSFAESVKLALSRRPVVNNRDNDTRDERLSSKLNSTELYNMIRAKRESNRNPPKRFFGWG